MVNLALVGVGSWGRNFIQVIDSLEGCNLKYLCAKSKSTLDNFPEKYFKTTNYLELLKFKDLDGVIIATPAATHFQITKDFVSKGFNVLVEKPITTNLPDALSLKKTMEGRKNVLMVGHIQLYNPAFQKAKLLSKRIGDIYSISLEGCNNGPFRDDISVLWDWGPHHIAMCLDILEREPDNVSAWSLNRLRPSKKLYDTVYLKLQFKKNIFAYIFMSWLSPFKKRSMIVTGSKSTLFFDDLAEKKITFYEHIAPKKKFGKLLKSTPKISFPNYFSTSSLNNELKTFVDSIKSGQTTPTNIKHGVSVTKILTLAEESINQNGKLISNFSSN